VGASDRASVVPMSNRKLRTITITIAATMQHEARGLTARSRRRKRPPISTERVRQHRERRRQGVIKLRITVNERVLIEALERLGHLEGLDFMVDGFVREAAQILFEEALAGR
jgi:hypothetical protein